MPLKYPGCRSRNRWRSWEANDRRPAPSWNAAAYLDEFYLGDKGDSEESLAAGEVRPSLRHLFGGEDGGGGGGDDDPATTEAWGDLLTLEAFVRPR